MHGRLRDAIHVDQLWLLIAMSIKPWFQTCRIKRLAAEDYQSQCQVLHSGFLGGALLLRVDKLPESRRGLIQHGYLLPQQQVVKRLRRTTDQMGNDYQFSAEQQCAPHLPNRKIKSR